MNTKHLVSIFYVFHGRLQGSILHGFPAAFIEVNIPRYRRIPSKDSNQFLIIHTWGRSPFSTTNRQDSECKPDISNSTTMLHPQGSHSLLGQNCGWHVLLLCKIFVSPEWSCLTFLAVLVIYGFHLFKIFEASHVTCVEYITYDMHWVVCMNQ